MTARTLSLLLLFLVVAMGAGYLWRRAGVAEQSSPRTEPRAAALDASSRHRDSYARVDDSAEILAPFVPRLARMADAFSADLGIDVHVVTSLDGKTPIETQAVEAFQRRQVARNSPTGGVLIILDPKLAAARIEVGYSLEGVMTDLHMSRVARDQLAPYVSYGSAGMAVMDVLHYLRDYALLAALRGELKLPVNAAQAPDYLQYQRFLSGGAGARTALAALPMDADLKKAIDAGRRSRYAPAATPEGTVSAFLRATRDLAGDPTLDLFTEGSRLQRASYPLAPFEEWRRAESIEASEPLKFLIDGDFAVATSIKPVRGFVPILLQRQQGVWRVDLVETWKNLFFDQNGNYFLRNSNTPYAFGLRQFGRGDFYDIAALRLSTGSISGDLALLEGRADPLSALRRGELWLRNAFAFPPALSAYEAALRAAPDDPLILETFARRAEYLGFPELAIPALEKIGGGMEIDIAHAYDEMNDPRQCAALDRKSTRRESIRWIRAGVDGVPRASNARIRQPCSVRAPSQPASASYRDDHSTRWCCTSIRRIPSSSPTPRSTSVARRCMTIATSASRSTTPARARSKLKAWSWRALAPRMRAGSATSRTTGPTNPAGTGCARKSTCTSTRTGASWSTPDINTFAMCSTPAGMAWMTCIAVAPVPHAVGGLAARRRGPAFSS